MVTVRFAESRFTECKFYRMDVILKGYFTERTLHRKSVLPKEYFTEIHFAEWTFRRMDISPKIHKFGNFNNFTNIIPPLTKISNNLIKFSFYSSKSY